MTLLEKIIYVADYIEPTRISPVWTYRGFAYSGPTRLSSQDSG